MRFPEFEGEWEKSSIKVHFDIYSGNTPSRLNKEHFVGEINWVTSGELKEHYIGTSLEKISRLATDKHNLKLLDKGTLVIAIYGLEAVGVRGTCSILTSPSTISQACMAFIPKNNIQNEFLYCWYKKHGDIIGVKYAQGTKQQNLSSEIINNLSISFPKLKEQVKLQKFISTLDQRISTQNKIIESLESLIKGLAQILRTQFQRDEFELGQVAEIYQPQTISQDKFTKGGYPVFGANGIIGYYSNYNHENSQICLACRGNTCGVINYSYPKSWITGNAMVLNVDNYQTIVDKRFLFHYLKNCNFSPIISGSGQPQIVRTPLLKWKLFLPSLERQKQIAKFLDSYECKLQIEKSLLEQLNSQKRFLLSQMFI